MKDRKLLIFSPCQNENEKNCQTDIKKNVWAEENQKITLMMCECLCESVGAVLGITDKMEAQPQPPLLISKSWDEGVKPCDLTCSFLSLS